MGSVFIGTSGYSYPDWSGRFYPGKLPQSERLEYYAERFSTVELNVTFYRLPAEEAFRGWRRRTPKNFRLAVKGSRFITHIKRLKDVDDSVKIFFRRVLLLREKLAVILWQLPPSLHCDLERLKRFVRLVSAPRGMRHTLEVRHSSWLEAKTYRLLGEANIALCQTDWPGCSVNGPSTADFVYIRRHGARGKRYAGRYSKRDLLKDARAIKRWRHSGSDVFCYFNNDQRAYAAANALELSHLMQTQ